MSSCNECGKATEYNGWPNYETWLYALWIDNDEGSYDYIRERARDADSVIELADCLKYDVEQGAVDLLPDASFFTDLLNSAISEINFYHVAEGIIEEVMERVNTNKRKL